jgi:hypothetical protein
LILIYWQWCLSFLLKCNIICEFQWTCFSWSLDVKYRWQWLQFIPACTCHVNYHHIKCLKSLALTWCRNIPHSSSWFHFLLCAVYYITIHICITVYSIYVYMFYGFCKSSYLVHIEL